MNWSIPPLFTNLVTPYQILQSPLIFFTIPIHQQDVNLTKLIEPHPILFHLGVILTVLHCNLLVLSNTVL